MSERQVRRLLRKLQRQGDKAVVHALRGQPSNHRISEATEQEAVRILSDPVYQGFGPTLAAEYLRKKHRLRVSKETLRGGMAAAGLWRPRRRRIEEVHQWRQRRSRNGETRSPYSRKTSMFPAVESCSTKRAYRRLVASSIIEIRHCTNSAKRR